MTAVEDKSSSFYAPMPDGRSFVNTDTGEIHSCFENCAYKTEIGDRIICPLSNVVMGLSTCTKPTYKKRNRDQLDTMNARLDRENQNRKRIAYSVLDAVFCGASEITDEDRTKCVDLAVRIHDWLGEKIAFDAITYATIMCMAEGASTETLCIPPHESFAKHIKPLRYVNKLGIRQNAVTKAYTAMMKKKGDVLSM
jgi:hypothetical protein